MERVVYLLGAGFSAPAGIPTIRDFLMKAKDQYFADPERYGYFQGVFGDIRDLHQSKTYIDLDLLNIEEILSALQMQDLLTPRDRGDQFARFIADVIDHHTPEPKVGQLRPDAWHGNFFGPSPYDSYGQFVGNLMNLHVRNQDPGPKGPKLVWSQRPEAGPRYGVVTLNYDAVIENCRALVTRNARTESEGPEHPTLDLACLHGTTRRKDIVPPTWTKGPPRAVVDDWRLAFRLFAEANHIRVLGYSLPGSDQYIKYLLCAAISQNSHLKSIDVICKDPDGAVARRYEALFVYRHLRFVSADILHYMQGSRMNARLVEGTVQAHWNRIESQHEAFMAEHRGAGKSM